MEEERQLTGKKRVPSPSTILFNSVFSGVASLLKLGESIVVSALFRQNLSKAFYLWEISIVYKSLIPWYFCYHSPNGDLINKSWDIHMMEYYSEITKGGELMMCSTTWWTLKSALNEWHQSPGPHILWSHLNEMFKIGKSIDIESGWMLWGREKQKLTFNG